MFGRTNVPDEQWIKVAGGSGMVVAHKDPHIRRRPAERRAAIDAKLRMLCLTNGNLVTEQQVDYFRRNLKAIEPWWSKPGPWILAIRRDGVAELSLDNDVRKPRE